MDQQRQLETLCVHAGRGVDPITGAVATPLHLSTTFERAADGSFPSGFSYIREQNPNRAELESLLATVRSSIRGTRLPELPEAVLLDRVLQLVDRHVRAVVERVLLIAGGETVRMGGFAAGIGRLRRCATRRAAHLAVGG